MKPLPPDVQEKVNSLRGQELTAKELKQKFNYSPTTYIRDTFLFQQRLIVEVKGTYPTLWRIK